MKSATVNTLIKSVPAPGVTKRTGAGIYTLASGNYTFPGTVNRFTLEARNSYVSEGRETMYGVVVYDNLSPTSWVRSIPILAGQTSRWWTSARRWLLYRLHAAGRREPFRRWSDELPGAISAPPSPVPSVRLLDTPPPRYRQPYQYRVV